MISTRSVVPLVVAASVFVNAAPSAGAPATFNGRPNVGPVLAADAVVWAQSNRDGIDTVMRDGRVIASAGASPSKDVERYIGAVGASATQVTYTVTDSEFVDDAANTQVEDTTTTPMLSAAGGAFTNPLACTADRIATVVEGDTVAYALDNPAAPCDGGVYVNGRKLSPSVLVSQLRLAGPYVAWLEVGPYVGRYSGSITVADVTTGATLATFKISGDPWSAFDIDAQGNIVAVHAGRLLAFTVTNAKKRTLSKRAWPFVATAGGRIAYVSADAKRKNARSLNLIDFN